MLVSRAKQLQMTCLDTVLSLFHAHAHLSNGVMHIRDKASTVAVMVQLVVKGLDVEHALT